MPELAIKTPVEKKEMIDDWAKRQPEAPSWQRRLYFMLTGDLKVYRLAMIDKEWRLNPQSVEGAMRTAKGKAKEGLKQIISDGYSIKFTEQQLLNIKVPRDKAFAGKDSTTLTLPQWLLEDLENSYRLSHMLASLVDKDDTPPSLEEFAYDKVKPGIDELFNRAYDEMNEQHAPPPPPKPKETS